MNLFLLMSEGGEGGLSAMFDVGKSSAIWTVVIFALSLPFMWKMVFGPIVKALGEREDQAQEAAKAAEAAREETAKLQESVQADLEEARREAAKQVSDAKTRAEEREKELLASAKAEAEKERARAKDEINQALVSARETLRKESVELGMEVAEKVLSRQVSTEDRSQLVSQFQKELG